jgi:hypothetical protein
LQHPEYLHPGSNLEMFLKQVRASPMMKYDMEHYRRLPDGHVDKNYDWVISRIHDSFAMSTTASSLRISWGMAPLRLRHWRPIREQCVSILLRATVRRGLNVT